MIDHKLSCFIPNNTFNQRRQGRQGRWEHHYQDHLVYSALRNSALFATAEAFLDFGEFLRRLNPNVLLPYLDQLVEHQTSFISRELVAPDATVLRFAALRLAVAHTDDPAEVARHYHELFFPETAPTRRKHDGAFLRQQFRALLRDHAPGCCPCCKRTAS